MKIVAIGGGNNSNIKKNGLPQPYEHENIDREIIKLSGKSNPNVLFISHASSDEEEQASFRKIHNTYHNIFSCPIELLDKALLENDTKVQELVDWADIIYVGGGNTKTMLELWKTTGFDHLLMSIKGEKVLSGISAGANCWFAYSCSDYLQMEQNNPNAPFKEIEGLSLVDLVFNPHANYAGRLDGMQEVLKTINKNGISLSNNMAIEIIDDEYRLIQGISSEDEEMIAILGYWKDGEYHTEPIQEKGKVKQLIEKR